MYHGFRLNWPDLLHILKEHAEFFKCLLQHVKEGSPTHKYVTDAQAVWATYYPLAAISVQAHTRITAQEWKDRARPFLKVPVFAGKLHPAAKLTTNLCNGPRRL
jgi:hypothetical protein